MDLRELPTYIIMTNEKMAKPLAQELAYNNFTDASIFPGENIGHVRLGCARSHLRLLQHVKEPPYIILEHDARIYEPPFGWELELRGCEDVVYLGGSRWGLDGCLHPSGAGGKPPHLDDEGRVHTMLTTHALLTVTQRGHEEMLANAEWAVEHRMHLDVAYAAKLQEDVFCVVTTPWTFYQESERAATAFDFAKAMEQWKRDTSSEQ